MKTALLELQGALYARLSSDTNLSNRINGVFDNEAIEGTSAPYIVLGEDTANDWGTKTNNGEEITHTLHVWSDNEAKKETKEIMNLILQSLGTPLSLGGGFLLEVKKREYMEVFKDPSGSTHGVIRLRFKIKE